MSDCIMRAFALNFLRQNVAVHKSFWLVTSVPRLARLVEATLRSSWVLRIVNFHARNRGAKVNITL
jgi:hypothetical protein